jgi:hypothetical protein
MSIFDGKGPKTPRGIINKSITGDGRVNIQTKINEELGFKPKKRRK